MIGLRLRHQYRRPVVREQRSAGQPPESMFVGLAESIPQWGRDDYDRFARESYGRIPLVYAIINAIATSAAEARVRPMVGPAKKRSELENAPIARLLKQPNPRQGWYAFGVAYHTTMQYSGNCFIYKLRNAAGVPVQLRVLRTGRMQIVPGPDGEPLRYIHRMDGRDYPIDPTDIIHVKRMDPADDWFGLAPLHVLARSIQVKVEMQKIQWASFHNGGVMSGILTMDRELDDDEPEEYRRQWRRQFSGLQAGGIAVFGSSLKYQQIATDLDKMALPDLTHLSDTEICSVFQTPPSVVYALISQARGAAIGAGGAELEDQRKWWENCLNPEMRLLMEQMTIGLRPDFGDAWELEADVSKIRALQDDEAAKTTQVLSLWNGGLYTRDQSLSKLGEEPIGGRAGAVYRVPNTVEEKTAEEMDEPPEEMTPPPPVIQVAPSNVPQGASPLPPAPGGNPASLPPGRKLPDNEPSVPGGVGKPREMRHRALLTEARQEQIAPAIAVFTRYHRQLADRAAGIIGRNLALTPAVLIPPEADAHLATELRALALHTAEATWTASNRSGLLGDVSWAPHGADVQAIVQRSGEQAARINDRARAALGDLLRMGEARGYTPKQIAAGVSGDSYPGVRSLLTEFYANRAPQLARAEVGRVALRSLETRRGVNLTADGTPSESSFANTRDARTRAFAAALLVLWRKLQAGEITRQEYDAQVAHLIQATADRSVNAVADDWDVDPAQARSSKTAGQIAGLIGKAMLAASAGAVLFSRGAEPVSDALAQQRADQVAGTIWAIEHRVEAAVQPTGSIGTWHCENDKNSCDPCVALDGQEFAADDVPEIGEDCDGGMLCRCRVTYRQADESEGA